MKSQQTLTNLLTIKNLPHWLAFFAGKWLAANINYTTVTSHNGRLLRRGSNHCLDVKVSVVWQMHFNSYDFFVVVVALSHNDHKMTSSGKQTACKEQLRQHSQQMLNVSVHYYWQLHLFNRAFYAKVLLYAPLTPIQTQENTESRSKSKVQDWCTLI